MLKRLGILGRGVAWTVVLNVVTTASNFAVALLLARLLGADGYGAFSFAFAWAMVLSSVAGLGLSPLVVRHVAAMEARHDWSGLRGLLRWSTGLVAGSSALTTIVAALVGLAFLHEDLLGPYLLGLGLVLPTALVLVRQSAMQGLGRVVLGRVPETLVMPVLFLVLAALFGTALSGFSARAAVALLLVSALVAFLVGTILLARTLPAAVRAAAPRYDRRSWARSAAPLLLLGVAGVVSVQVGTILLGVFAEPEETGVFALALRLSAFASFLFMASMYPLMPTVARLHSLERTDELRATVGRAARAVFLFSLPIAVGIAVLAEPLLGLFGDEFRSGADAVRILVLGEIAKVFLGLSGLVLVMTGREDDLARGVVAGAVVTTALSLALIPRFDVVGAAVATSLGALATHLLLTLLSRRRLGFAGAAWWGQAGTRNRGSSHE